MTTPAPKKRASAKRSAPTAPVIPPPPVVSPDGRYEWNGSEWTPIAQPPALQQWTQTGAAARKKPSTSATGCGVLVLLVVIVAVVVAVVAAVHHPRSAPDASTYTPAQQQTYLSDIRDLGIGSKESDSRLLGYGVVICRGYTNRELDEQITSDLKPYVNHPLSGGDVTGLLANAGLDLCPAAYSADSPAARASRAAGSSP